MTVQTPEGIRLSSWLPGNMVVVLPDPFRGMGARRNSADRTKIIVRLCTVLCTVKVIFMTT